ncbi:MAG TPA: PilZ domain-containing protein [Polyangia bacterium]|nr:PilZ domain-containing protein [Polyangia bacterium]
MTQARRVSPRIRYDEAICLGRIDGRGRIYGRGVDLSASGLSLVSAEWCPIGTEIRCDLLLPHGPRPVTGKIVRVTAAPGGFELAVSFGELKPATTAAIDRLIAARSKQVLPAKLRVGGVDRPLRCEAQVGDEMVHLTATLPFLRLDGGVDVVLGAEGAVSAAGTIRRIAVDPATRDGVPRLALDVALDAEPRSRTRRYGAVPAGATPAPARLPPTKLPPPCGHPLPSVVLAAGLARDARAVEARPPRRRVHGTAEVARRPDLEWGWRPAAAMAATATLPTERLHALRVPIAWSGLWWLALIPLGAALLAALTRFGP